MQLNRKKQL